MAIDITRRILESPDRALLTLPIKLLGLPGLRDDANDRDLVRRAVDLGYGELPFSDCSVTAMMKILGVVPSKPPERRKLCGAPEPTPAKEPLAPKRLDEVNDDQLCDLFQTSAREAFDIILRAEEQISSGKLAALKNIAETLASALHKDRCDGASFVFSGEQHCVGAGKFFLSDDREAAMIFGVGSVERGAGTMVMLNLLEQLREIPSVTAVGLFAADSAVLFYEKLGFKLDGVVNDLGEQGMRLVL